MILNDKRLAVCARMVEGDYVCDIGTDHGYLPAFLLCEGKCSKAAAADINSGPLAAAENTFEKNGVSDKAQLYLSDGLKEVPLDGVTDIVIAGMGGELIAKILSDDKRSTSCGANFILQPMTRQETLRKYLAQNGFAITEEKTVIDGKFSYVIIKCRYNGVVRSITETEEYTGSLDPSVPENREYIARQRDRLLKAAQGMRESQPERADKLFVLTESIEKYLDGGVK